MADSTPSELGRRFGSTRIASTLIDTRAARADTGRLELVVIEPRKPNEAAPRIGLVPLLEGSLDVGRGGGDSAVDVILDDDRASKVHARIHVSRDGVEVEDLGSRNGTFFENERIEGSNRVRVGNGENIRIGGSVLVVRRAPLPENPRVCHYNYFLARTVEECRIPARRRPGFAIVRVEHPGGPDVAATKLEPLLDGGGLLASYGGDQYLALVRGPMSESSDQLHSRVRAAVGDPMLPVGIAVCPEDGVECEQLLEIAARRFHGENDVSEGAIVVSEPMRALYSKARRCAQGTTAILLLGETGSGKDQLARYIRAQSPRADGPFVAVNCATLNPNTSASELFGHERGAFTGALTVHRGCFEQASGGTLFLDEIGELGLELQAQLLRVFESGLVRRLGGEKDIQVDVRVLAATNADIVKRLREKTFRQDLHYRLAVFTLTVPPLRDRAPDILPIAQRFADEFCRAARKPPIALSAGAASLLESYPWPGNVRELRNVIERAVVLAEDHTIEASDLDFTELSEHGSEPEPSESKIDWDALSSVEKKQIIVDTLIENDCVKKDAAKALGMGKERLLNLMRSVGLRPTQRAKVKGA